MDRTLLLTQGYEPLTVITWRRAICMVILGKVEVVEEYDWDIRSISLVIKVPAVVRLLNRFKRHRPHVRFSRSNVLARDRWTCQYCGQRKPSSRMTCDHVVPRSLGGRSCWENIVAACHECNARKANRTPEQAGMRLQSRPRCPDWVPICTLHPSRGRMPEPWRVYVSGWS